MNICFVTDVDIGAQFYMVSKAFNTHTSHKTRSVVIARNYLEHPHDIWLGTFINNDGTQEMQISKDKYNSTLAEIKQLVENADFFVFRRDYFFAQWIKELTPFNHIMVTYGSEARLNPAPYYYMSEKQNITHVSSLDYSQSCGVGFSAHHIPISLDLDLVPLYGAIKYTSEKIKLCYAPTDEKKKGTSILENVLAQLDMETVKIKNMTWAESLKTKSTCDVNFDQIWLGCYGMSSVESMAMRQPSLAYVNGWVYSMYPDLPVINVTERTIGKVLKNLVHTDLSEIGKKERAFVERYHDVNQTVKRWEHLIKFVSEEKKGFM
jgi:hypothetical protein